MNKGLWYFAHPYTCYPLDGNGRFLGEEANFRQCCIRTAKLLQAGCFVFSPIVHCHPIHLALPQFIVGGERKLWIDYDKLIIRKTDFAGLILAPGWRQSEGCREEFKIFRKAGKPIKFYAQVIDEGE